MSSMGGYYMQILAAWIWICNLNGLTLLCFLYFIYFFILILIFENAPEKLYALTSTISTVPLEHI
jgi:hypothetical protein